MGASGGGIYKSGSYTQIAALDNQAPFAIVLLPPSIGMVVVTNTYGAPPNFGSSSFYLSTDNGATFNRLGAIGQFLNDHVAFTFDVPGKTIYAVNPLGNEILKWVARLRHCLNRGLRNL